MLISITGKLGSGKSTVAKILAKDYNILYLDTGAMYRSLAYKAISLGLDITSDKERIISMLSATTLDIVYKDGSQHMLVDNKDVTDCIRTPEVSQGASAIAVIPEVRKWLLEFQRELAKRTNCLMDGRDIGTVVLPFANIKIFLTASGETRAKRRYDELIAKGECVTYEDVLSDMIARDKNDSTRACAPLKQAEDANNEMMGKMTGGFGGFPF